MVLASATKFSVLQGELCPVDVDMISLPFKLTGEKLGGEQIQTLPVKVALLSTIVTEANDEEATVDAATDENTLKVEKLTMTDDGKLTIRFNRVIKTRQLKFNEGNTTTADEPKRRMSSTNGDLSYDINDAVLIKVEDEELEDEFNRRIDNVTLLNITDYTLEIGINFSEPNDITAELT